MAAELSNMNVEQTNLGRGLIDLVKYAKRFFWDDTISDLHLVGESIREGGFDRNAAKWAAFKIIGLYAPAILGGVAVVADLVDDGRINGSIFRPHSLIPGNGETHHLGMEKGDNWQQPVGLLVRVDNGLASVVEGIDLNRADHGPYNLTEVVTKIDLGEILTGIGNGWHDVTDAVKIALPSIETANVFVDGDNSIQGGIVTFGLFDSAGNDVTHFALMIPDANGNLTFANISTDLSELSNHAKAVETVDGLLKLTGVELQSSGFVPGQNGIAGLRDTVTVDIFIGPVGNKFEIVGVTFPDENPSGQSISLGGLIKVNYRPEMATPESSNTPRPTDTPEPTDTPQAPAKPTASVAPPVENTPTQPPAPEAPQPFITPGGKELPFGSYLSPYGNGSMYETPNLSYDLCPDLNKIIDNMPYDDRFPKGGVEYQCTWDDTWNGGDWVDDRVLVYPPMPQP